MACSTSPLGMESTSYGRDASGNPITFSDVRASCRDLARFGYLYLRGGSWRDDRQIISKTWVENSIKPATHFNPAYGYLWWINPEGLEESSSPVQIEDDTRMTSGLPEGFFAAAGAFNQIVAVIPGTNIVFTRLGGVGGGDSSNSASLVGRLTEQIHAALLDEP